MSRTTARTAVMQMIYEHLCGGEGGDPSLKMAYDELRSETADSEKPVGKKEPLSRDKEFIDRAYQGVLDHQEEIDAKIAASAQGWSLERISIVDHAILLLGAWELLYEEDVPAPVAINEAVNLANRYSIPEQSGAFVNGILGAILRKKDTVL